MPVADARSVAVECLHAGTAGDLHAIRSLLHEDVRFVGPQGPATGIEGYLRAVELLASVVRRAEVQEVFVEGGDVCIFYDLVIPGQVDRVPTVSWYRVRDGRVASVRAFLDLRPPARGRARRPSRRRSPTDWVQQGRDRR